MSYSLSLVWGHSVHFAKFLMLRFSKATPTVSIPFQPNFMEGMTIKGNTGYYFLATNLKYTVL